ncbi:hypothetical protein AALO_G00209260 [Alosa alosa]|uniref:Uncharacterized protein n=1 Tax=Alosa alosa TaxID=278164 RepID=A0AAV6G3X5_9TELE|nr:hypothetical protein AALO_G00209260 [Alosa alosa]
MLAGPRCWSRWRRPYVSPRTMMRVWRSPWLRPGKSSNLLVMILIRVTWLLMRFLEHYILNGPDPKALDAVLEQLNDRNRKNPQNLDKAVAAHIHQVKQNLAKTTQELIPVVFSNT